MSYYRNVTGVSTGWLLYTIPTVENPVQKFEALVEREVRCPHCRRLFCKVWALPNASITPICDGCVLEGRC